ncbi:uncharacterized protein IL334_002190 [Kwoniella shivajii]|uniref:CCAAT-binding factor domain-containing protein n=1 Tax=Kwoniella shivajii TaxID=564305 RepID=A0ABZ1CY58_9TREE|nr:hypothetical protein IL334_002190 [Kwoniella shivajii]
MVSSLRKTKAKIPSSSKAATSSTKAASNPLTQISKLESTLLGEEYDPNPLLSLVSLARHDDPEIVHRAVWALHRVFIKYIGENRVGGMNGDLISKTANQESESDVGEEREVKAWVRERLLEYIEILVGLMRDTEPALRSSSVPLLFSLLPPLSMSIPSITPLVHIPYLRLLLHSFFNPTCSLRGARPKSSGGWKTVAANQVEEDEGVLPSDVSKIIVDDFWAKYDDIRWAYFKEAGVYLQNLSSPLKTPSNLLSQLLPLTNLPKAPEDINAFYISAFSDPPSGISSSKKTKKTTKKGKTRYTAEADALPDWMKEYESSGSEDENDSDNNNDNDTKGKNKKRVRRQRTSQLSVHSSVYSVLSHTTFYTILWENVLSFVRLDDNWIRKILVGLHGDKGIMGHFKPERRLRIADWLGSLVDQGGANGMLGINGLFILMTQYNFEYPHFYDRLYGLLDRNVMHVKYRARFFRLLDTFLASSLLSSALIASFIKRLSRLALTAPPAGVILILPFIYNLFKRHPGTMVLLQRPDAGLVLRISSSLGQQGYVDPYDENEPSPLKTKAIDSSAWELAALQKHYLASVGTIAKVFGEVFTKPEFGLEDFLDHGYSTLFETETNRKIRNPPALSLTLETATPESALELFPSKDKERSEGDVDIVSQLWAF